MQSFENHFSGYLSAIQKDKAKGMVTGKFFQKMDHPKLAIESQFRTGQGIRHYRQQVIPAQAGIQKGIDSCFRRNDRRSRNDSGALKSPSSPD